MGTEQALNNVMHLIEHGQTFCDVLCAAIRSNNKFTFDQACQLAKSYNIGRDHQITCPHNFFTWCVENANNIRPTSKSDLQAIRLALLCDPTFIEITSK